MAPANFELAKKDCKNSICPKTASPYSHKNSKIYHGFEFEMMLMLSSPQAAKLTMVLMQVKWNHHENQYGASVIPIIRIDSLAPDSFSRTRWKIRL